jgi:hypothetical protein
LPFSDSSSDPKRIAFRDLPKRSLTDAGLGSIEEKAAAAIADYMVLDMFANFCTVHEDAKGCYQDCRASVLTYVSLTSGLPRLHPVSPTGPARPFGPQKASGENRPSMTRQAGRQKVGYGGLSDSF